MAKKAAEPKKPADTAGTGEAKGIPFMPIVGCLAALVALFALPILFKGCGSSPSGGPPNNTIATATQQNTGGNNNALLSLIQINGKDSGSGNADEKKEGSVEVNSYEWSPIINFTAKNIETFGDSECYYLVDEHMLYYVDSNQGLWKIDVVNGKTVPRPGAKLPRDVTTFQLKTMKGKKTVRYVISPLKKIEEGEHSRQ